VAANDPRVGYRLTVRVTYRQPVFVPLLDAVLGGGDGVVDLRAAVTMVVN
jgi:hypothetical protein